jgi:TatD DNase family protein
VDTHGHPHLQRVGEVQYAASYDGIDDTNSTEMMQSIADKSVVSLTCAVSPLDWKDALDYASQSSRILPALGIHPWYLGDILVKNDNNMDDTNNIESHSSNIERYIDWHWLNDLETYLSEHPRLIIGEIGLCKMARFVRDYPKDKGGKAMAMQLQKLVFSKQLQLAARWSRPVTVHCVDAHGIFMETLWDILRKVKEDTCRPEEVGEDVRKQHWRKAFPSAIAMHSFTGTAHQVNEILAFERALLDPEDEDGNNKAILFYFGVSHSINHLMCTSEKSRKKGMESIRSIPANRLLVESDVHASVDVTLGTAGAVAYAAYVRDETIEDVAKLCVANGLRFLSSCGCSL